VGQEKKTAIKLFSYQPLSKMMMKSIIQCLLIFIIQLRAQTDTTFYHPFIDSLIQRVDSTNISQHISNLSWADGNQSRVTFTSGNIWAADYIKQTLESYPGLTTVEFDTFFISGAPFPYNSFPLVNVMATLNGNNPSLPHYIIGGHFDASASLDTGINWSTAWSTVHAQGADDNASGVAIILEIARILSDPQNQFNNDITIKFIAFGAEESNPAINNLNHQGSSHYATAAYNLGDQIAGVYVVDMVGFSGTMYHHFNIVSNQGSSVLGEELLEVNQLYQIGLHSNSPPFPYATYSDHDRFWLRGYKAILLIENAPPWNSNLPWYIENPYYHTREDTPERVNLPLVTKIAKLTLGTIACLTSPSLTDLARFEPVKMPEQFLLLPNYPNPFNTTTTIPYVLSTGSQMDLTVYNLQGQLVAGLYHGWQSAGAHQLNWRAVDAHGNELPSGMYLLRFKVQNQLESRKIMLIK
jgi:hypothetical protein